MFYYIRIILLILITHSQAVFAWSYSEHAYISFNAYLKACSGLERKLKKNNKYNAICNTEIAYCYANMVAIAGDHSTDALNIDQVFRELERKDDEYVDESIIDISMCSNIFSQPESLKYKKITLSTIDINYVNSSDLYANLEEILEETYIQVRDNDLSLYFELAASNKAHFQPKSKESWKEELLSMYHDEKQPNIRLKNKFRSLLANAYSSHFLQDSFSSGHIGHDRNKYWHDYSNAYHDDINHTGLFVKNGNGDWWYAYGDGYLCEVSKYIKLDQEISYNEFLDHPDIYNDKYIFEENNFILNPVIGNKDYVISISVNNNNPFCNYFNHCDKEEFIVVNKLPNYDQVDVCSLSERPSSKDYYTNKLHGNGLKHSYQYVLKATEENIGIYLKYVLSDFDYRNNHGYIKSVNDLIPSDYKIIKFRDRLTAIDSNGYRIPVERGKSQTVVSINERRGHTLTMTDYTSVDKFVMRPYGRFSYALTRKEPHKYSLDDREYDFSIAYKFTDNRLDNANDCMRTDAPQAISSNKCVSNLFIEAKLSMFRSVEINNEYEWELAILSTAEGRIGYNMYRKGMFTISPVFTYGWDRWYGRDDGFYYIGAGVEVEVNFAKHIASISLVQQINANSLRNYNHDESSSFVFSLSYRLGSLSF